MDRQISYTGSLVQNSYLLGAEKAKLVALGYAMRSIIGPSLTAQVDGLACNPTVPASLSVTVGPGSIYVSQQVDTVAFSDLGTDTTHNIVKQGILQEPGTTLTVTPPGTSGYSQNYLVQVAFSETDGGSTVLPYYNSANPAQPWSGPNNSGTSQNTVRTGGITVQLKAGVAAPTGSQTTPAPDSGFTGLYVITVANGATTVVSGNIVQLATAPFFPVKLPAIPGVAQSGIWNWAGNFGGTANALTYSLSPTPIGITAGLIVSGITQYANTSQMTLGGAPLVDANGFALPAGYLQANQRISAQFDGTSWRLMAPATGPQCVFTVSSSTNQVMSNGVPLTLVPGANSSFAFVGNLVNGVFTFSRPGIYHVTFDATLNETVVGANQISGGLKLIHNGVTGAGGAPTDSSYASASGTYTQGLSLSTALLVAGGDTISVQGTVTVNSSFTSGGCSACGMTIWLIS